VWGHAIIAALAEAVVFDHELESVTSLVRQALDGIGIPAPEKVDWVPTPFSGQWGFGTAVCYQIAAAEAKADRKVNVRQRAAEIARLLAGAIEPPAAFARVVAENAYINFYLDTATYVGRVVDAALAAGPDFGRGAPKHERLMVEYVQPNTHHSFHIGHLRNAVLGESLARLVEFAGFETIRASYPGDIGLGVITVLWAYNRFYRGQEPSGLHERGQWLLRIYAEAVSLLTPKDDESPRERAQRETYDAERREMYRRWDAGDPEVRELWRVTRQWSLDELSDILQMLDVRIDVFFFESEVEEPAKEIVGVLIARGIAEDERPSGPVIVKIDEKLGLKKEKYRTAVILRSDGTTLYLTKDLALAREKFEKFLVDRSVYVVDVRQSLHFQQVFKILELFGFPQAAKCFHLAHGFVTLPEGAMSARKGNVVLFMDVLDEAQRRVQGVIADKNPSLIPTEREDVARKVGLGALVYALLAVDNPKDIVFNWDAALSFDGQSAPYIQNAHVRANSILRKAGAIPDRAEFDHAFDPLEIQLIDLISRFPAIVQQAALEYKPLHMATYAFDLAKAFHGFYHAVPVLQAEAGSIRDARIRLTAAARQTLANSLRLLVIQAPDVM
jgi:arginyl-tRNA synthetase